MLHSRAREVILLTRVVQAAGGLGLSTSSLFFQGGQQNTLDGFALQGVSSSHFFNLLGSNPGVPVGVPGVLVGLVLIRRNVFLIFV